MRRGDIIVYTEFTLVLMLMFLASSFPEPWRTYAGLGAILCFMPIIMAQEALISYVMREHQHLTIVCRHMNGLTKVYSIFFDEMEERRTVGSEPLYMQRIKSTEPIKIEGYGKVRCIQLITGSKSFDERVELQHGFAEYMGFQFGHPKTAVVVVWERESVGSRIDTAEYIPVFELAEAPKDRALGIRWLEGEVLEQKPPDLRNLLNELAYYKNAYNEEHSRRLWLETTMAGLRTEMNSLLDVISKKSEQVVVILLSLIKAFGDIYSAYKAVAGKSLTAKALEIVLAMVMVGGVVYILSQHGPEIGLWLSVSTNQVFLLIALAIIVAGLYFYYRRRR